MRWWEVETETVTSVRRICIGSISSTPDVLPTLPGTQPLTPRDLDRGFLVETSASAQLVEERAGFASWSVQRVTSG
jgi:hypothetical protein